MFGWIKNKIILILGTLLAVALGAIKILTMVNAKKEHENMILKENAATNDRIHKDEVKREKFNSKQEEKVKQANDDSNLARELAKRGGVKDEDNFTTIIK